MATFQLNEVIRLYKLISELWHGFLGSSSSNSFRSSSGAVVGRKRGMTEPSRGPPSRGPPSKRVRSGRQKQRDDMRHGQEGIDDIDIGLQRLFGPTAQWKSDQQRDIMAKIMALQDNGVRSELLIAVLPTGGGKSVFFMLPAVLDETWREGSPPSDMCSLQVGSTSIVVVPFAALLRDMEARAREMGVDCLWWRTGEHDSRTERQRDARLVLVSADVAVCVEFMAYVQTIRSRGRLGRIFFDECHTSITDVGYRARLGKLKELHRFGCPMIMLTATLPVTMEAWYRERMLCKDAALIRTAAVEHNIRYRVRVVWKKGGSVQDVVLEEMRQLEKVMTGSQKGVVYCRSIAACEQLGEAAGCGVYHSRASEDANQGVLKTWMLGQEGARWITAMSGLGTGIDIGGITAIIHMQEPYGLVDFVQQTGRGGRRAGEVVESVIVTDGRPVRENEFEDDISRANRTAMGEFIRQTDCRHIGLGMFLDGTGRRCGEIGGELCDHCRAQEPVVSDVVNMTTRLHDDRRATGLGMMALRAWVDTLTCLGACSVCYVKWHIHGKLEEQEKRYQHPRSSCRYISIDAVERWRQGIQFDEYRCCWSCGLPYGWCAEARVEGRCIYREHIIPVVMMVGVSGTLGREVAGEFGVDVGDSKGYQGWLVRSRQLYEEEMTNGLAVWEFIVRTICK